MPAIKSLSRGSVKRKKVQRPSRGKGIGKKGVFGSIGLILLSFVLFFYFQGNHLIFWGAQSLESLFVSLGFTLEDVVVEGRHRTEKKHILKVLDLQRGKPILSIPLQESKKILEQLPWVKAVRMERRFPKTLFIRISEKEPAALWQHQSKTYLVDRNGEVIETKSPHEFKELLYVTGQEAPKHVESLITVLEKFPQLKTRVTSAKHFRATRWDIRLDDRIDVRLPEMGAEEALAYLLDLETHHRLVKKDIMSIDMRLPGQLILRLTPEAAQRKNDTGKDA